MADVSGVHHHPGVVHDLSMAEIRDRDEFLEWLKSLPALERARLARALANTETTKAIGALGDEAVYELTREATWADVAEKLGVSVATVNKAVSRHRGVARPRKWPQGE